MNRKSNPAGFSRRIRSAGVASALLTSVVLSVFVSGEALAAPSVHVSGNPHSKAGYSLKQGPATYNWCNVADGC